MKIGIAGGLGFIGSSLVIAALRKGHSVTAFTRKEPTTKLVNHPNLTLLAGSIEPDANKWLKFIEDSDAIIDATGHGGPARSGHAAPEEISEHLKSSAATIDQLAKHNAKKIILLSSAGTVYGSTGVKQAKEEWPLKPIGLYGATKASLEAYSNAICTASKTELVILRISNPFGPLQLPGQGQGLIANALGALIANKSIEVWGSGEETRDYIYIDDLTEAILMGASRLPPDTYNVASGTSTSVNSVIGTIETVTGKIAERIAQPTNANSPPRISICNDKIKGTLPWEPRTTLEEGISLTWNAFTRAKRSIDAARINSLNASEIRATILSTELSFLLNK